MKVTPSVEPQDARSAFTRSRVFRGPHDENPYIPIRGWNHPFLDSMQFPRGHVRPPVFRGFLSSAVYRRRAEGPDEKAWARIRAIQCVLGRGVCFCRPSGRRTARFLQQISSYKRLLPLAVEDALRGPRKMPDQRIADEADFGGLLKMACLLYTSHDRGNCRVCVVHPPSRTPRPSAFGHASASQQDLCSGGDPHRSQLYELNLPPVSYTHLVVGKLWE